jgi:hypothetical protein
MPRSVHPTPTALIWIVRRLAAKPDFMSQAPESYSLFLSEIGLPRCLDVFIWTGGPARFARHKNLQTKGP